MEIIYILILTVFASMVGTLTGFGISTIMVPVLVLYFPLAPTLLLVGIIHWFGNIWKITIFKQGISYRLIMQFGIPGIPLAFLGALLVFSLPEALLSRILGAFLISYAAFLIIKPKLRIKHTNATIVTGGALSGFFAGIIGVGGAIRAAALSAFDLPKEVYIATTGAIGLIIDSVRLATYISRGAPLSPELYWGLLLFIPSTYFGTKVGKKIIDKIPQKWFRTVVASLLLFVGIRFLLFPL